VTLDLAFTNEGWEDYQFWVAKDRTTLKRVNALITDVRRDPTSGIGKPEQLRYLDGSPWSRRITQEHRLVYTFTDTQVTVWQCRYHY
jgi:toxin YoeB